MSLLAPSGTYDITPQAASLLPAARTELAVALKDKGDSLQYNQGYVPSSEVGGLSSTPRFSASFDKNDSKTITIIDPQTDVTMGLTPQYATKPAQASDNRVVYPLIGKDAQSIYTLQIAQMKEDIIVNSYQGDSLTFSYELSLPNGTEARMEQDGSVGIYSVDPALLGDITTGTEADATLLQEVLEKGERTTLLFSLPAPFIKEFSRTSTAGRAWYSLEGNILTLHASELKNLNYPISIDPTIYIETAAKLMQGNNESNVDFDVSNELIQKGKTTGGRFDDWIDNDIGLPAARWNHATAMAGGYIYSIGGNDGTSDKGDLYWAHFNPNFTRSSTNGTAILAANPGSGTCSGWCTNSAYDLPSGATRRGAAMVAYNGYLYLFGGLDNSGNRTSTVYIAKLGANGEPQRWHPSDSDKSNWVYWYSDTSLDTGRAYLGAAAYNNRMYLIGGTTNASTTGTLTVQKADINPTGELKNWTTTTALTAGNERYGMGVQIYNDYLYVIGGAKGTTTQNSVFFNKINNDGTLNSWQTGTSISNGASGGTRASMGGTMTTIWGGYIYVAGGCTTMNASGYCTSIANDIQLASINADGSITDWTTVLGVSATRMGYSLEAWRGNLYAIGGCSAQNTTTGACTITNTTVQYGVINQDGDASTVSTSVANGTSPCDATNGYYNCDLPPQGDKTGQGGRMSGAAVLNNGYIYYMGGCTAVGNNSVCYTGNAGKTTANISYASIDSVGHITRVSSCAGTFVGSWCVISSGNILGNTLAAFSYAVFNNTLYIIGGTTGTEWQDDVWRTTFNTDGTWGSWSSQTFAAVGLGAAKGYQYSFTRANPTSASTNPGNLYVLGGCSGTSATDNGLDCSGVMYSEVYKCNIQAAGTISGCTTSGQLQIDSEPSTAGTQGLGVMAGTVYANYVYMIGGQSPNEAERGEVMYAKIDNSNNIVAVSGSDWITSPYGIDPVRRRGIAFGYNGYLYALAGFNVSEGGSLNDLLYAKIDVSDGSIGEFTTSHVTVSARWDLRTTVNNGYVYAIGGCSVGQPPASCSTMTGTVQTFQLYNNYSGSPKSYSTPNLFATDRYGAGAAVLNGYLYVAGGCTTSATNCGTPTSSVQYTAINADGTLGTWASTTALTAAKGWGKLLAAGGTLYYIGGQTGNTNTGTTNVYWATPSGTGTISSWSAATNGLPAGRTQSGAAVWNDRLYVVGGYDASGSVTSTVYVSPQQSTGGDISNSWSTASTAFNVARANPAAITYANNLYILGGNNSTNYLSDVQFSQISTSNGTAGSWSYSTSLPSALSGATGFARNGFMYLFGGRSNATTCTSNTIVAPISANTTIATGNNPTGIGEWYATNVRYSGNRYGAAAVYNQGKTYVMGGICNGTFTGSNRVQASTLQSQPQIARYSRLIDTDSDVFPTYWLMNGLDNSIGARWNLTYRSMTDPYTTGNPCSISTMTTWGQDYNYGNITIGSPGDYIPLDGSGADTNCARYYYLSLAIDSSQAYGYPEDVSRGPTISDLSLFFTADPSKRLMHGRTFTGGIQQPIDAPINN